MAREMKDGYYWARLKAIPHHWDIVNVLNDRVIVIGDDTIWEIAQFEFGDRIEIPEKYES